MIIKEDFNLNSLQYWISDGVITSQDQRLAAKVGNSSNMSAYNVNCCSYAICVDGDITNVSNHQTFKWGSSSDIVVWTKHTRLCSYLSWAKAAKQDIDQ